MSRIQAQLVDWNDQRGFGFARLPGGSERVFIHIKSLNPNMPRPSTGDRLEMEIVVGRDGRPAGVAVDILGVVTGLKSPLSLHVATAAMLLLLLQLGIMLGVVPAALASLYVSMGAMAIIAYSWDKKAARLGIWRISELKLHIIDFCGGIIGGLLAQQMYSHKRSKSQFQKSTMIIVVVHAVFLGSLGAGLISL